MSLERIVVFLLAEICLLHEALARVLRKKDDLVVAGAIPFSSSALEKVWAANPDVARFDSASIALTGPCLVSRMRRAGEKLKAVMVGVRLGLSNKGIGNRKPAESVRANRQEPNASHSQSLAQTIVSMFSTAVSRQSSGLAAVNRTV